MTRVNPSPLYTVVVALSLFLGVESWVNDYDKPFTFTCPSHQSINRVVSHHDNGAEDRKFDFQCTKYTEGTESCFWSGMLRYTKMLGGNLIKFENTGNYRQ